MTEPTENYRMTPEQLQLAGSLLYGNQWQTDLARALEIDSRRIRDWLSGRRPIPVGIWNEVISLLEQNSVDTLSYAQRLKEQFETIKESIPENKTT
ncbi:helix-turn-helix domain-containing protein [Acinetobacter stercoris]|uniref:Uncharacterized protein n=1 Tax=Acinetobacter stercoris TaxID=2126983 RepID=A0A2U3N538_9GAMM|nr:transcriptional regulator [Acinetobacter stercoris]SPL72669.1 hypothetical protein KPC_3847 [Acinetobacter stercoris]